MPRKAKIHSQNFSSSTFSHHPQSVVVNRGYLTLFVGRREALRRGGLPCAAHGTALRPVHREAEQDQLARRGRDTDLHVTRVPLSQPQSREQDFRPVVRAVPHLHRAVAQLRSTLGPLGSWARLFGVAHRALRTPRKIYPRGRSPLQNKLRQQRAGDL